MDMSLRVWDEQVVPRLADASLRGHEIGELRDEICQGLTGRVLEIGFGSGLNVRWYPPQVDTVSAVEPSDVAWSLSTRRRERSQVPIERAGLDGQHLDLPDDSYDSALVTFSLCTIPDPVLALSEIRRVLRPGARLHALEHGLSPDPGVRRWQHRLDRLQGQVAGGCHLTRDVSSMLEEAGWPVQVHWQRYLPGPRVSRPWTWLTALTASSPD